MKIVYSFAQIGFDDPAPSSICLLNKYKHFTISFFARDCQMATY